MKHLSIRSIILLSALSLLLALCGCVSNESESKKAAQEQIDNISSTYDEALNTLASDESFIGFSTIGIDPVVYTKQLIDATTLEIMDVAADDTNSTVTVKVSHPDVDKTIALMTDKAKEFESSEDYTALDQEERFARSNEMLNEAIAASGITESEIELSLSKSDSGWSTEDNLTDKTIDIVVKPDQSKSLVAAMKPFGWKYDNMNSSQIAELMKETGLTIGDIQVFDETSDPNSLLGRPNEYTSKVYFLDSTMKDPYGLEWVDGMINTDLGGTIEVFSNSADAKKRADYLQGMMDAGVSFNKMYLTRKGSVILRIGYDLIPSQASAYEAEFLQKSE